ncbi:MAG: RHS repeat-associated core domain-containing protein [Bacteroidota bacterium]
MGSIREVIAEDGVTVLARYDCDPYGNVTALSGSPSDSDFLYTGHYYHQPTGLHLALYRAYDAQTGRWLSRDPIEEGDGLNIYAYVGNEPVGYIDLMGLTRYPNDPRHNMNPQNNPSGFVEGLKERIKRWLNDDYGHTRQLWDRCKQLEKFLKNHCPEDKDIKDEMDKLMDWCRKKFGPKLQHRPEKGKQFVPYEDLKWKDKLDPVSPPFIPFLPGKKPGGGFPSHRRSPWAY